MAGIMSFSGSNADDPTKVPSKCTKRKGEPSEDVQVQPTEKKRVISALFLYFGVRFYHLLTQVEETRALDRIPFSYFELDGSTEMKAAIREDMKVLCSGEVGMKAAPKKFRANGGFVKLPHTTQHDIVAYVYKHTSEHATCSSTKLSQIQCCLTVNIRRDTPNISQSYPYHRLLPFYHDNSALLPLYQKALAEGCADLQAGIDTLQSILSGKVTHIGTQFESPCTMCTNWSENDWTKRLVHGIKAILPKCNVKYTANLGQNWDNELLQYLGLEVGSKLFLFRGAPDVVIRKNTG